MQELFLTFTGMTDSQFHNQATPDRQEPGHTDNGTRTKAHNKKNRQQAENINITYANVTETVAPGGGGGGHTSGFTVTSPPLGGAVTDTVVLSTPERGTSLTIRVSRVLTLRSYSASQAQSTHRIVSGGAAIPTPRSSSALRRVGPRSACSKPRSNSTETDNTSTATARLAGVGRYLLTLLAAPTLPMLRSPGGFRVVDNNRS